MLHFLRYREGADRKYQFNSPILHDSILKTKEFFFRDDCLISIDCDKLGLISRETLTFLTDPDPYFMKDPDLDLGQLHQYL